MFIDGVQYDAVVITHMLLLGTGFQYKICIMSFITCSCHAYDMGFKYLLEIFSTTMLRFKYNSVECHSEILDLLLVFSDSEESVRE